MCLSVESLIYQCLFAVSTKLIPYESIITSMGSTKWDLKEIPSIHSRYVDVFISEIRAFNEHYIALLKTYDLAFMIPGGGLPQASMLSSQNGTSSEDLMMSMPLVKLEAISRRINPLLWECITRVSNRCFVEGFASSKKCTNEGRALMQLDYQQFLSHMEKIIAEYFFLEPSDPSGTSTKLAKALLIAEKEFVEEYVKAYYLTEAIFLDWIRQRNEYTTKQIVSLVNCIAGDNRKLKSSLLAAIDTSSNTFTLNVSMESNNNNNNNVSTTSLN